MKHFKFICFFIIQNVLILHSQEKIKSTALSEAGAQTYLKQWLVVCEDDAGIIDSMTMWEGRDKSNMFVEYADQGLMIQNKQQILIVDRLEKMMYLKTVEEKGKSINISQNLVVNMINSLDSLSKVENWEPDDTLSETEPQYQIIKDTVTGEITQIKFIELQPDEDNPDEWVKVHYILNLISTETKPDLIKNKCKIESYLVRSNNEWKPGPEFKNYELINLILEEENYEK